MNHYGVYDVAIIGGGPGGYVAAIRASQVGLKVALVERSEVGGVCLHFGCIPTKALLRGAEILRLLRRSQEFGITCGEVRADFGAAVNRSRRIVERLTKGIQFLLRKNRVDLIPSEGRLLGLRRVGVSPSGQELEANHIIIATGGRPRSLPGLEVDGRQVIISHEAVVLGEVPRRLIIIGGGAIGVEFAYLYNAYGCQVTIVEMLPHLLPLEDEEVSAELQQSFRREGIHFLTGTRFERISKSADGVKVMVSSEKGQTVLEADKVLVAVGVEGNVEKLGLEELGISVEQGFIQVDDKMQTNVPGIYAVGDVTGKLPLAHVASAQGEIAVETIAGRQTVPLVYENIPRATYCRPQVASLGLTEAQAKALGYKVKVGKFPFRASGKAMALGESEGFVKIVSDASSGKILGAHLIGAEVTELLPAISLTKLLFGTHFDIAHTVHAHPTLSEAVMEAARAVEGEAIHI